MAHKGVRAALHKLENDLNTGQSSAYCTLICEEVVPISPSFAHALVKIHVHQESGGVTSELTLRCLVLLTSRSDDWQPVMIHPLPH